MFRILLATLALSVLSLGLAAPAHADKKPVYTGIFSNTAVGGHDPVAYFTEGKPVEGKKEFSTEYQGAEFRFASAENLALFEADPEKYAPQFGGYCAWAVAQGDTAKGDPDYWKIVDGKLYLNYNKKIQERWEQNEAAFIEQAETNWPAVLK
ncbi:YHS domain-containing (seleno)protein [Henriciella mobilis]|uniref:YHS domain-containing protein n=1 Tax=Henriciella mobilis TaxID=2305467 RepID=A0A399RS82_9PROT|nr:YHS domain-containing (seleno)protein [Henriciella mobilis]RIJ17072.1 YHS domain-containing protein [Henriciella mobilis]RIJ22678.1 YHS domain-containing protein [Henriciella mobilis]RIJ32405.1 YHS domain-containing protein [Henriciella mobilis]